MLNSQILKPLSEDEVDMICGALRAQHRALHARAEAGNTSKEDKDIALEQADKRIELAARLEKADHVLVEHDTIKGTGFQGGRCARTRCSKPCLPGDVLCSLSCCEIIKAGKDTLRPVRPEGEG